VPSFLDHRPQPVADYRDGAGHTNDRFDVNMQRLAADAEAAYGSALRWAIARDTAHARKAVEILDAWASTLRRIDPRDDGPLSTSYGWPTLIYAAELVRGDGPWPPERQAQFTRVLRDLVWPSTGRAVDKDNGNNWKSLGLLCRLAIAVHTDDRRRFDEVIAELRRQIPHYVYANGQALETPRDFWHVQMGIAPLIAAAEIAWHQGVDLYAQDGNRLLTGVEWHAPFILGDVAGWPTDFSSTEKSYKADSKPRESGQIWPFHEMVYHHYQGRNGIDAPNTWRLLSTRGRPEGFERTGGWGTLTHGTAAGRRRKENRLTVW
jgi:Alginate lyase